MPYLISDLLEGHRTPVTVQSDTVISEALRVMVENDFSQLPVVDEHHRPGHLDGSKHSRRLDRFSFPTSHRRRIRTANSLERLNREVRRRSRVAVFFPNVASCERLVTAVLMEISEEWETNRTYMRLDAEEIPF